MTSISNTRNLIIIALSSERSTGITFKYLNNKMGQHVLNKKGTMQGLSLECEKGLSTIIYIRNTKYEYLWNTIMPN